MQTTPIAPKRKFELTIKIGADDHVLLVRELDAMRNQIAETYDQNIFSNQVFPASNALMILQLEESQTPEGYQKGLEEFMAASLECEIEPGGFRAYKVNG